MTSFGHVSDSINSSQQALWALLEKAPYLFPFLFSTIVSFSVFSTWSQLERMQSLSKAIWFATKNKLFHGKPEPFVAQHWLGNEWSASWRGGKGQHPFLHPVVAAPPCCVGVLEEATCTYLLHLSSALNRFHKIRWCAWGRCFGQQNLPLCKWCRVCWRSKISPFLKQHRDLKYFFEWRLQPVILSVSWASELALLWGREVDQEDPRALFQSLLCCDTVKARLLSVLLGRIHSL